MQFFNPVDAILVRTERSWENFEDDYADALREAIDSIRAGLTDVEIYQNGELLHSADELLLAEEELDEYFTDEDLVEQVHYAVRRLEGDDSAWAV